MKYNLKRRDKIVIGSIALIIFLVGLHVMVFSRKAREYDRVMDDWEKAKQDVKLLVGASMNRVEIKRMQKDNKQYNEEFAKLITELKIDLPKFYIDPAPENIAKRHAKIQESVEKIRKLDEDLKDIKLSFLRENGWKIPKELPEEIRKRPERLWDVMAKIQSIDAILKVISNQEVHQRQMVQYDELLKEIGINEAEINGLVKYGKFVPFINRLCHYRLIIKNKPDDVELTNEGIQALLRIKYEDNELFKLNRQIEALTELIDMAAKSKVDEISQVTLMEFTHIKPPPEEQEVTEDAPVQQVQMSEAEMMMGPMGGPMGRGGQMFEPGMGEFGGRGGFGTGRGQEPEKIEKILASGIPIMMQFEGSNLSSTNFLYTLSHSPRTYELDSLIINTDPEKEGITNVFALINVLALVEGIVITDLSELGIETEESRERAAAEDAETIAPTGEAAAPPAAAIPAGGEAAGPPPGIGGP